MDEVDIKALQDVFADFDVNDCIEKANNEQEVGQCQEIADLVENWQSSVLAIYMAKNMDMMYSIKTKETLDSGFGHPVLKAPKTDGLIYGKSYTFALVQNQGGYVSNKNIQWSIYLTDENESNITQIKSEKGKEISFSIDDADILGKFIIIEAVIQNGTDFPLTVKNMFWIHYRFRHINFVELAKQIKKRCCYPEGIDQRGTNLCGAASVAHLFALYQWDQYGKFIVDIHHKGIATIKSTGYVVDLNTKMKYEYLIEGYNNFVYDDSCIYVVNRETNIAAVDFLFLVVMKAYTNLFFKNLPEDDLIFNDLSGVTLSENEIELMKNILGCKDVKKDSFPKLKNYELCNKLKDFLKEKSDNEEPVILFLVNHHAFTPNESFEKRNNSCLGNYPTHWIVIHDIDVEMNRLNDGEIVVKEFTWGKDVEVRLSKWLFDDGLHTYLCAKVKKTRNTIQEDLSNHTAPVVYGELGLDFLMNEEYYYK